MTYSVGLQNVGSYQVSGRPWSKTLTVTDGTQEKIELPSVSKKIRIKKQENSGTLYFAFRDMFTQRSRAVDINIDDFYQVNVVTTHTSFCISFWLYTENLTSSEVVVFQGGFANDNLYLTRSGTSLVIRQTNTKSGGVGLTETSTSIEGFSFNEWHNFTYQYDNSSNVFELYVDGVRVASDVKTRSSGMRVLRFSNTTAGTFDGPYDEISFWNKSLGQQEVSELYNQGNYYDPRTHSAAADLLHWWAFEDGVGVGDSINSGGQDTILTIQDRVGGVNLSLQNSGVTDAVFVNSKEGWFVESTTATFGNTISIVNLDEFEISCKCKDFYIYADGADVNVDIFASLTNIPSSRMYDLTGPGINE